MFIIIVFDSVLPRSTPVSSQDFYCSLPRNQSRDATPRLGVFCYSPVYFTLLVHLYSGYYYYDYLVAGVLRPSWFTDILF